jgi:hypothetical protein
MEITIKLHNIKKKSGFAFNKSQKSRPLHNLGVGGLKHAF